MQPINPNAIVILVANPVDILTTIAQQLSGLPKAQVFGSGTFLDTERLRGALADRLNVRLATFMVVTDYVEGGGIFGTCLCPRRTR
jgi:L-lactate dehydrogenase